MNVPFGTVPGFLPGAASLVEQLDRRVLVVLRDGRHLTGVVRSFDQFSNLVLEDAKERRFAFSLKKYADKEVGLYIVRGDSVIVLGEVRETFRRVVRAKESIVGRGGREMHRE